METENSKNIVHWGHLSSGQSTFYIAATLEGLCYVGSPNAPFDELSLWVKKQLPTYELIRNESYLEPYVTELIDFLEGRIKKFKLPLDLHGTAFQKSVWAALQNVPFGETVSYTDVAKRINRPDAVRAVGTAISANPVLITVPCHRIIGKNGKLTGYRGGLEMKKQLLELERS